MTLYINEESGFFGGTATAGDIKRLGLIRASLAQTNPRLRQGYDEDGNYVPDVEEPKGDEDEW